MAERVTSAPTQVGTAGSPNERVTSTPVQVATTATAPNERVTLEVLQVGIEGEPNVRVTAEAIEILGEGIPSVRVTSHVVEVLRPNINEFTRDNPETVPATLDFIFVTPGRSVRDTVTVAVDVTRLQTSYRSQNDAAGATEAVERVRGVPRNNAETVGTSESLALLSKRPFIRAFGFGVTRNSFTRPFDIVGGVVPSAPFIRSFDIVGRSTGSFIRPFDMLGAGHGSFVRPFDIVGSDAPTGGIILPPPPEGFTGTTLADPATSGDTSVVVDSSTGIIPGMTLQIGSESRVVTSVSGSEVFFAVGLTNSYPTGTIVSAPSGFIPQVIMVFDKAGNALGLVSHLMVANTPRQMIGEAGDFEFAVPRNSPDVALIEGDRLVAVQSNMGLPLWAGTMITEEAGQGQYKVTCPDLFDLLTELPVSYKIDADIPALGIYQAVLNLANDKKAAVGDLTFGFEGSGAKLSYGNIEFTDQDPLDIFTEIARRSGTEFAWRAEIVGGKLTATLVVSDHFETTSDLEFTDGPGGNIVADVRYTRDTSTAYNAIKLTGASADISECLPDWASWAGSELVPEITVERDPGVNRRRVTLELNVDFGLAHDVIESLCQEIEAQLWFLYRTFLYAYHDQYGRPFHPGWTYEGPPEALEQYLHTGLNWRTRRRFIVYKGDAASSVMISRDQAQILVVTYDRINAIQRVFRTWFTDVPGTLYVNTMHVHGYAHIYDVTGGVIVGVRKTPFDHSKGIVGPELLVMWPGGVPAVPEHEVSTKLVNNEPIGSVNIQVTPGSGSQFKTGAARIGTEDVNIGSVGSSTLVLTRGTKIAHDAGVGVYQTVPEVAAKTSYKTLRRIISITEEGAITEGMYVDMDTPTGPTSGVYYDPPVNSQPVYTRPVVGDDPYKFITLDPATDYVDYEDNTHIFDFELNRIGYWDPRRDGVGSYFNKLSIVDNAPSTKARWHIVPWGTGGERQTSLLTGVNATGTQIYVTSTFDFLNEPLPFKITVGQDPGDEIMLVTAINGTLWTVVRGQDGTTAIIHEPEESVVLTNPGDVSNPLVSITPADWPQGKEWAEQLLDTLGKPTIRLVFQINNRDGAWSKVALGSIHTVNIDSEGKPGGIHGTVRVIGLAPDEARGALEVLVEWQ